MFISMYFRQSSSLMRWLAQGLGPNTWLRSWGSQKGYFSMHLEVEVPMLFIVLSRYVWVLIRHPYILKDLQAVLRPCLACCTWDTCHLTDQTKLHPDEQWSCKIYEKVSWAKANSTQKGKNRIILSGLTEVTSNIHCWDTKSVTILLVQSCPVFI